MVRQQSEVRVWIYHLKKSMDLYALDKIHRWTAPKSQDYEDIIKHWRESTSFSFTVRKEQKEPFRHTCIELQFDDKASFIISRRIPDKTSFAVAILGAPAVIYIEKVKRIPSVNCGVIFKSYDKEESKEIIFKLLQDSEVKYNLWDKNCRDHVTKTVMNAMEDKKWTFITKKDFLKFVEEVREEDRRRVSIITIFYILCISKISIHFLMGTMSSVVISIIFRPNSRNVVFLLVNSISTSICDVVCSKNCSFCKNLRFQVSL